MTTKNTTLQQLNYGFSIELKNNEFYVLKFLDIPHLTLSEITQDAIFQKAQPLLDDYLYSLLKKGQKIPLPKVKASHDKMIAPSEPIKDALSFYFADH